MEEKGQLFPTKELKLLHVEWMREIKMCPKNTSLMTVSGKI